jgi:hypothetical protein
MKKTMAKIIAVLLILILSAGSAFAAVPGDVQGQSYEAAVSALMDKGIITGDTGGNFNPESVLTRAQACIIIVKSMNPPSSEVAGTATQPASKSGFSDMTGYSWADGYVAYAVKHGVAKGYPDGSFKPGNTVTMNELLTMVLRAAAFTDDTLGGIWPSNYIAKANELELLKGTPDTMPANATKWIAAQVDYNALALIEKANPKQDDQSGSQATPAGVPDTATMTYLTGSFSSDMTTFNGKYFSDDAKIYAYGKKASYSSIMSFSNKIADYRRESVYKYKNVETPAFYRIENGKITEMVIPRDVGFTGLAYVVINGTYSASNVKDESVTGLTTLAAGKDLKWLCEKNLAGIPSKTATPSYLSGLVYELKLTDGVVKNIASTTPGSFKGKVFSELSGNSFVELTDYSNNVASLDGVGKVEIKSNATIYVMDAGNQTEYTVGKQSDIKKGNKVRIYDMSDDDEMTGDIIVVLKN